MPISEPSPRQRPGNSNSSLGGSTTSVWPIGEERHQEQLVPPNHSKQNVQMSASSAVTHQRISIMPISEPSPSSNNQRLLPNNSSGVSASIWPHQKVKAAFTTILAASSNVVSHKANPNPIPTRHGRIASQLDRVRSRSLDRLGSRSRDRRRVRSLDRPKGRFRRRQKQEEREQQQQERPAIPLEESIPVDHPLVAQVRENELWYQDNNGDVKDNTGSEYEATELQGVKADPTERADANREEDNAAAADNVLEDSLVWDYSCSSVTGSLADSALSINVRDALLNGTTLPFSDTSQPGVEIPIDEESDPGSWLKNAGLVPIIENEDDDEDDKFQQLLVKFMHHGLEREKNVSSSLGPVIKNEDDDDDEDEKFQQLLVKYNLKREKKKASFRSNIPNEFHTIATMVNHPKDSYVPRAPSSSAVANRTALSSLPHPAAIPPAHRHEQGCRSHHARRVDARPCQHIEATTISMQVRKDTYARNWWLCLFVSLLVLLGICIGLPLGLQNNSSTTDTKSSPTTITSDDACHAMNLTGTDPPPLDFRLECLCFRTIRTDIPNELQRAYDDVTEVLLSLDVIRDDQRAVQDIQSCSPSTFARLVVAHLEMVPQDMSQGFVLASLYMEWGGFEWTSSSNRQNGNE
jgi:hypothetical protein